jgi:hypothetical protein
MMNYIEVKDVQGITIGIYEESIGCIPTDLANSDYQAYLESLQVNEAKTI